MRSLQDNKECERDALELFDIEAASLPTPLVQPNYVPYILSDSQYYQNVTAAEYLALAPSYFSIESDKDSWKVETKSERENL